MATLEECPTCGNQTSENANQCPACGEPLSLGWADTVRELREQKSKEAKRVADQAALTQKKAKRKKLLIWGSILAVLFVWIFGEGIYDDFYEQNLKLIDPTEYQKRIKILESLVAVVPATNYGENIRLYRELQELDPENARYAYKISHYQKKKKAARAKAKSEKAAKAKLEAAERAKIVKLEAAEKEAKAAREAARLAELRINDPDAYLTEIKGSDEYMSELKALRPDAYRRKLAEQEAEQKEAARRALMAGKDLELIKWSWQKEYSHAIAEGLVKNISGRSLSNVTAVVIFKDESGNFISSGDALVDYNPILSGQTSPFKVYGTWNPAMAKASVQFKKLLGGTLSVYRPD